MKHAPNVVLIVMDTLHADGPSTYGDEFEVETPNIDSLGEQGTVFENAFATGPNTEISHASLFTGQYPTETGISGGSRTLPDDIPVLAEWFRDRGYDTFGISGPGKISSEFGYDRGFNRYVESYKEDLDPSISTEYLRQMLSNPLVRRDAFRTLSEGPDSLTSLKFDILEKACDNRLEQPFFSFVNLLSVHDPYRPPRPEMEQRTPAVSRPRWYVIELLKDRLGRTAVRYDDDSVGTERVLRAASGHGEPYYADNQWLTDREMHVLREWYAAELRYMDRQLGAYLQFIEESGLREDTVILLTGDHGEYFGEHGLIYHGYFLYDEVLHVPLIVSGVGIPKGNRVQNLVSLVDVFDTLADVTGGKAPETTSGESAFGTGCRNAVYAEYGPRDMETRLQDAALNRTEKRRFGRGLKCIRTEEYRHTLGSDGEQTYQSLSEESEGVPESVRARLHEQLTGTLTEEFIPSPGFESASTAVRENLKELGYL
jgi:arylsulfatase A-like enzyme